MSMLRKVLLVVFFALPSVSFAQLSKGEGGMITIPGKPIRCYLPKHFTIQSEPAGVVHKESGTMVIAVKIPAEKRSSTQQGLSRNFFENPGYQIVSLNEEESTALYTGAKLYTMLYTIQGYEFERRTLLLNVGIEQYLIIGNYPTRFKPQVIEEVDKIMSNFIIR